MLIQFQETEMAAVIIHFGLQPINFDHTQITSAQKMQGERLFSSGHIFDVKEVRKHGFPAEIQAECISTNVNGQFSIRMRLNSERKVTIAQCQCDYGLTGQCKHLFALMLHLNR